MNSSSNENTVENNKISSSGEHGINLNAADTNVIAANRIANNDSWAVKVEVGLGNLMTRNNIIPSSTSPDSGLTNNSGNPHTITRNYWNTTDESSISQQVDDPVNGFIPYRLGQVDTGVGADTFSPASPVADTAVGFGGDSVVVRWQEVTQDEDGSPLDFGSYRIYRTSLPSETDWKENATLVGTTATAGDTDFVDTPVPSGDTLYYRVTAVDGSNPENESFFSDTVSVKTSGTYDGPTWYVNDGDTTGDQFTTATGDDIAGDGSLSAPFATITTALNQTSVGDTVKVDAGTYGGTVTVDTDSLALVGVDSGPSGTMIDVGDSTAGTNADAINIDNSTGVSVKNLRVTNAYDGIAVFSGASGVTIRNITALHTGNYGIQLSSDNNTVRGSLVRQNGLDGISIQSGTGNLIENNVAENNDNGIRLWGISGSTDNTIRSNVVENNSTEGLVLTEASSNRILRNTIQSNGTNGVLVDQADSNYFAQNTFRNNTQYEISFIKTSSGDTFEKNNIITSGTLPDSAVLNKTGDTHNLTRNYWNSADRSAIRDSIQDTATSLKIKFSPFRLGAVDTGVGADTNAPADPTILSKSAGDGTAAIEWTQATAPDFLEYRIYRDTDASELNWKQNAKVVTTIATASDTDFTDTDVLNGDTYYYRVTAVDNAMPENESFFSDSVTVTPEPEFAVLDEPLGEASGLRESAIASGDVTEDGDTDLVVIGHDGSNPRFIVYRNEGSGTFTAYTQPMGTSSGFSDGDVALADITGNGVLDIVTSGTDGVNRRLIVWENNGDGSNFSNKSEPINSNEGLSNSSVELADLDIDGYPELIASGTTDNDTTRLIVFQNDGSGNLSTQLDNPMGTNSGLKNGDITIADVNGDGNRDFVASGSDSVGQERLITFINQGSGQYNIGDEPMGAGQGLINGSLALRDINNDAQLELVSSGHDGTSRRLLVFQNNGSGQFSQVAEPMGSGVGVDNGDIIAAPVTPSGLMDLVVTGTDSSSNRRLIVFEQNSSLGFTIYDEPLGQDQGLSGGSLSAFERTSGSTREFAVTGNDGTNNRFILYNNTNQ